MRNVTGPTSVCWLAFVAGAAHVVTLQGVGELFGSEIALPLCALAACALPATRPVDWPRSYVMLLAAGIAMLLGYVIADVAAGAPVEAYARGWARVVATVVAAVSLGLLIRRDRMALSWFAAAWSLGSVGRIVLDGDSIWDSDAWKLGFSTPLSVLACVAVPLLPRAPGAGALAAIGIFNVLRDNRALGAVTLLAAGLYWVATQPRDRGVRAASIVAYATAGALIVGAGAWAIQRSSAEFSARQLVSNTTRFNALLVGAQAILDNPLLGYGSWGWGTAEYAQRYYEASLHDLGAAVEVAPARGTSFTPHSQILQAWMEGGILAATFFLLYLAALIRALARIVVRRYVEVDVALVTFLLLNGLWHAVMSPFAGFARLNIVVAMSSLALVLSGTSRNVIAGSSNAPLDPSTRCHQRFNIVR